MVKGNTTVHHSSVPDHLSWTLLDQLFCCHSCTHLWSLNLLSLPQPRARQLSSTVQLSNLGSNCSEDNVQESCKKPRRLHLHYTGAWSMPGHAPHQHSLWLTDVASQLALRPLSSPGICWWSGLSPEFCCPPLGACPSNSLPVSRKALSRLPGFFLITSPWLWAVEAVTRFFSPSVSFPGYLYYLCLLRSKLTTFEDTWGVF